MQLPELPDECQWFYYLTEHQLQVAIQDTQRDKTFAEWGNPDDTSRDVLEQVSMLADVCMKKYRAFLIGWTLRDRIAKAMDSAGAIRVDKQMQGL